MNQFEEIFKKYPETDKVTAGYHIAYEEIFGHIRNDIKLLFEIGVNKGGSIRAFREYFPNALIVGLEIDPQYYFKDDIIQIEIGDATNPDFVNPLINKYGFPDIVIDDGSHFSKDIKASFNLLYPYTTKYYAIEDLGTQTINFQNGYYVNDNEPAIGIFVDRLFSLLEKQDCDCKSIKIYPAIGFIEK